MTYTHPGDVRKDKGSDSQDNDMEELNSLKFLYVTSYVVSRRPFWKVIYVTLVMQEKI